MSRFKVYHKVKSLKDLGRSLILLPRACEKYKRFPNKKFLEIQRKRRTVSLKR